jgi:hypothetical protein
VDTSGYAALGIANQLLLIVADKAWHRWRRSARD